MSSTMPAPAGAQLDLSGRKGRYGVAYLDAVVTSAGFDMTEPRPGADMLAFDVSVAFPEGDVRVQVKTTDKYSLTGTNARLTYSATQHWVDSWAAARCPVYFVVVVVPKDMDWIEHGSHGTTLVETAAYWSRIDASSITPVNMSVAAERGQRLDAGTLLQWQKDFLAGYEP